MQKNKYILIVALMAVFVITNGTFFVLCEKDVVLDYINKFGTWTTAGLYHSAVIFGVYKLTDYAYNLDYILPKLINSLAPVKWVDRLNGYLGFSSKGELEQYLASHSYNPLYKDVITGFYSHIGYPFYNYWYAPLVGVKPLKQLGPVVSVPEPVVLEYIKEKKVTVTNTKYHFIDKHDEDILRLNDALNNLADAIKQDTLAHLNKKTTNELREELLLIKTLEDIPTYSLNRLKESFLEYNFTHIRFNDDNDYTSSMRIEHIQFFKNVPHVKIKFESSSPLTDYVLMSTDSFSHMFPVILDVGRYKANNTNFNVYFCPAYDETVHFGLLSRYNFNPTASVFREMDVQYQFFKNTLMQYGYEMPSVVKTNALEAMETYQLANAELLNNHVLDLNQDIRLRYIDVGPNNPQDMDEQIPERTTSTRQTTVLPSEESSTLIEENLLPAMSVGVLTTLTASQALVLFSYFFGIETFQAMIHTNMQVQEALINLYHSNYMELPPIISDAINNSPISGSSNNFNFDSIESPNGLPSNGDNSFVKYLGYGVAALGAFGVAWYLTKYGVDASPAIETAKTFKETLQEKYVNFK